MRNPTYAIGPVEINNKEDGVGRLLVSLALLVFLVVGFMAPPLSHAQAGVRCFDVPGIVHCIEGRFREFWEQNGGLAVFGYPTSPATTEQTTEGTFVTQYFERNRFELHPEKPRPYDVLLGRLGDDRLKQQGRDWATLPKAQRQEGCLYFAETGHNVCDQEPGIGFKSYWEAHGLQDRALNRFARSLALFGLPLSEPEVETNAAGDRVLTQWFERARFEYHPNKPREFKVLLGLLGSELWPACRVPLTGGFGRLWTSNSMVRGRLGCPVDEERVGPAAEQIFERGLMYWWSGNDEIYALMEIGGPGTGMWARWLNTWREGEPLAPRTPPPGLHAPQRGFGKVWREQGEVESRLGWARAPETGLTGVFQPFERGVMLYSWAINGHGPQIYVLYDATVQPRSAFYETFPD